MGYYKADIQDPELKTNTNKNLMRFLIITLCMTFAGLVSGYLVSKGGQFWVYVNAPMAFWVSTMLIIISSKCMFLTIMFVKKEKEMMAKMGLMLTFMFGMAFMVVQFYGWKQLYQQGFSVSDDIITQKGRFELHGIFGEQAAESTLALDMVFAEGNLYAAEDRAHATPLNPVPFKDTDKWITLKGAALQGIAPQSQEVKLAYDGGFFYAESDVKHENPLNKRLINSTGQLLLSGMYGKDYTIVKRGQELEFAEGYFYFPNGEEPLNDHIIGQNSNTASSYLYILTVLHWLHVMVGLILLMVVMFRLLKGRYSANYLGGLKITSTYWHFVGGLWLFLFLFLFFIR